MGAFSLLSESFTGNKENPAKKSAPVSFGKEVDVRMEETAAREAYKKIVEHNTYKSGRLSCDLLNKDLIRFAHSSSVFSP